MAADIDPIPALRKRVDDLEEESRRLGEMRERADYLEEENRWLRDLLRPADFLPAVFPLTATEETMFRALMARPEWRKADLYRAIYGGELEANSPDIRIIDVMVCKIRKKLRPRGVTIDVIFGHGVRLSPGMHARVAGLIASERKREADEAAAVFSDGQHPLPPGAFDVRRAAAADINGRRWRSR